MLQVESLVQEDADVKNHLKALYEEEQAYATIV